MDQETFVKLLNDDLSSEYQSIVQLQAALGR
jgi:hypothetical protein